MVYPANGAADVPDGNFPLVLTFKAIPSVRLTQGATVVSSGLSPTPVPSPIPTPTGTPYVPSPDLLAAYRVPALEARTTYAISQTFPPSPCYPSVQTIGTFTTR